MVVAAAMVLASPAAVMAHFSGGGFSGGGHVGGFSGGGHVGGSGGRSNGGGLFRGGGGLFSGGGKTGRDIAGPGTGLVNRGGRVWMDLPGGGTRAVLNHGTPERVVGNGRSAYFGGHRIHGRRFHGFIAGLGLVDYWYYDDCWVWTESGWFNLCGLDY